MILLCSALRRHRLNAAAPIVTHDSTVAEGCPRNVTLRDARTAGDLRR